MMQRLLIFTLAIFAAFSTTMNISAQDSFLDNYRFQVCEWGIVMIELRESGSTITIDSPDNYSAVDNTFTVSGTGSGLFENTVIVELQTAAGEVILTEPLIMETDEIGGDGTWSLDVDLSDFFVTQPAIIIAYSQDARDGSIAAEDRITVNVNGEFGLPFIEITSPQPFSGVLYSSQLTIEGTAGAIFENNIVIEILDADGELLVETFATVETEELAGRGSWSTQVDLAVDAGTPVTIHAYQPAIADGETVTVETTVTVINQPLSMRYDRVLHLRDNDPLLADGMISCDEALVEFDNQEILQIPIVTAFSTETPSPTPSVGLEFDAQGASICPLPVRTRLMLEGNEYTGEHYYDISGEPVACTSDIREYHVSVPMGTFPDSNYNITLNGFSLTNK